ncbi:MAG TPA: putative porin, partial [Xanthomonadales bacterium]|nr:putative porin [Xanthomonadales bacterium]
MNPKILIPAFFLAITPAMASAQPEGTELKALRAELIALAQRLDRLEASNRELREENTRLFDASETATETAVKADRKAEDLARQVADSRADSWADRIRLKGDFRMRYENIDEQNKSDRNRSRVRARAAILGAVSDDLEVGLGLASGGDDPVSTNQTLGGGGSTKDLRLDLAYFKWSGMENTSIVGGKFKNFLHKPGGNGMLWDGDWNPEGVGVAWASNGRFMNLMGTWEESDSNKTTEFSWSIQGGFSTEISEGLTLTAGLGYYQFGTQGKGVFYGDDDDFFGNSFDPMALTYLYDYNELELFAELDFSLGGRPANIFLDYVQNQDAPSLDTGYALGLSYGAAKSAGDWQFSYTWQDLEEDAAFGLVSDSDFGGGGTGVRGHILKGGYTLAKNWKANVTYLINERAVGSGSKRDYDR